MTSHPTDSAPPYGHVHFSPFLWGLPRRLALAGAVILVLWLAVGWALDLWG
ncbi:MAG: hypothetical protein VB101_07015 [Rhodospirillaceae bacterium]|nr:hypothetical protein [Rhodospirillaceae bacterium]MEA4838019.1 hypothetical protein [Rhodospirillaceae bacterium]